MPDPTGPVRTKLELLGEREYERELQRAQQAMVRAQRAAAASSRDQDRMIDEERRRAQDRINSRARSQRDMDQALERDARARASAELGRIRQLDQARTHAADRVRGLGDAMRDTATGGVSSIVDRLSQLNPGFYAAAGATAAFSVVISRLAGVAGDAARSLYELGQRGGDVADVAAAFERLASTDYLRSLHEASDGFIRDMDLMVMATEVFRADLGITRDEWLDWVRATTQAAQDMHRDVGESLQTVAGVLSGGRMTGLRDLGVNILEINEEMQRLGIGMDTERGRVIALRLAMGQLNEDLRTTGESTGNVGDTWQQLGVTWQNWVDQVARGFAENEELVRIFDELNEELEQGAPNARNLGDAIGRATAAIIESASDLTSAIEPISRTIDAIASSWWAVELAARASFAAIRAGIEAAIPGLNQIAPLLRAVAAASGIRGTPQRTPQLTLGRAEEIPQPTLVLGTAELIDSSPGRGGGRNDAARRAAEELSAIRQKERQEMLDHEAAVASAAEEARDALSEFWREDVEGWSQQLAKQEEQRIAAFERRIELTEELRRVEEERARAEEEHTRQTIERAEQIIGAVSSAAAASQTIFSAIGDYLDATGRSTEEAAEAEGKFLIAYSVVMALVETAEAIVAFAKQRYDEGIAHSAAVVAYGIAAATAAARLGGGSGATAPSAGAAVHQRQPEPEDRAPTASRSQIIVHQYSLGRSSAEAGEALRRLDWEADRQGVGVVSTPGVAYS